MGCLSKTPELPPLEERFTYALSHISQDDRYKNINIQFKSRLYFLFNAEPDLDTAKRILRHPLLDILPGIRYGAQLVNGYTVTNDINIIIPRFCEEDEQEILCLENGNISTVTPKDVVDACQLPNRFILGCGACLEEEPHPEIRHCRIKQLYLQKPKRLAQRTLQSLRCWKNLSKTIEGFKFISPACVQKKVHFVGRVVGIDQVDFEAPEDHRKARQEIAQTQARLRDFRNTVCAHCLVLPYCGSNGSWCSGSYDKTEEEYSKDILDRAVNPYTDDEFWYLFDNAGMLDKRYKHKRSYVTFRYRDGLEFVLGNLYEPQRDPRPLSFEQAKEIIEKYRSDPDPTDDLPRRNLERTVKLKALLIAMAALRESPRGSADKYYNRYRLPVRFIQPSDYDYHRLEQVCFTHPKKKRRTLTIRFEATTLLDIYKSYRNIPFIRSTPVKEEKDSWRRSLWTDDIDGV